jgi:hypothetical protein
MLGPLMAGCWLSSSASRQFSVGEGAGVLPLLLEQLASLPDLSLAAVSSALGSTRLRGIGLLGGSSISAIRLLWSASSWLCCGSGRGRALYRAAFCGAPMVLPKASCSKVETHILVCNACCS